MWAKSWSISANSNNFTTLSPNTPSANQLTMTNANHYYTFPFTLTASVTVGTNPAVNYTLPIVNDTYNNISASYVQDTCTYYNVSHPAQSGTASASTAAFVHMGCDVRVATGAKRRYIKPAKHFPSVIG